MTEIEFWVLYIDGVSVIISLIISHEILSKKGIEHRFSLIVFINVFKLGFEKKNYRFSYIIVSILGLISSLFLFILLYMLYY